MFCNKCGEEIKENEKYCNKCGNVIEQEQEQGTGTITFIRKKRYCGFYMDIKIFIDGKLIVSLKNGEEKTVTISLGKHKVMLDVWSGNGADEIEISKEHPRMKAEVKIGMGAFTSKPKIEKFEYV